MGYDDAARLERNAAKAGWKARSTEGKASETDFW
jgi:hypothetical protein